LRGVRTRTRCGTTGRQSVRRDRDDATKSSMTLFENVPQLNATKGLLFASLMNRDTAPRSIDQRRAQNHPLDATAFRPRLHPRFAVNQFSRCRLFRRIARADFCKTAGRRKHHDTPRAGRLDQSEVIRQHPNRSHAYPIGRNSLAPSGREQGGEGCREHATTRHPASRNIGSKHSLTRLLAPSTPTHNSTTPSPEFGAHAPRG